MLTLTLKRQETSHDRRSKKWKEVWCAKKYLEIKEDKSVEDEILDVQESVNKEWEYYLEVVGVNVLSGRGEFINLRECWEEFKRTWDLGSMESEKMFEEMTKLSDGLLREWRHKYNYDFPHVYEGYGDVDYYNKTKVQMWEEFKDIWEIDVQNYDEELYEEMRDGIEDEIHDHEAYFNFRENANYHSYYSYSVREKCRIWRDFCTDAKGLDGSRSR